MLRNSELECFEIQKRSASKFGTEVLRNRRSREVVYMADGDGKDEDKLSTGIDGFERLIKGGI